MQNQNALVCPVVAQQFEVGTFAACTALVVVLSLAAPTQIFSMVSEVRRRLRFADTSMRWAATPGNLTIHCRFLRQQQHTFAN